MKSTVVFGCWFAATTTAAAAAAILQAENEATTTLYPSPVMGWNSWNAFACDITEETIKAAATALLPYQSLGYKYINLDDCWMSPNRTLTEHKYQADPDRFPSGMKALGDSLHALGFRYGIYTSAGTHTCQGLPGSLGSEYLDAQTFADWGVDFVKYDNCYSKNLPGIDRYTTMRDALAATGRPMVYSICQWGGEDSWQWAPAVGDLWRSTGDINAHWASMRRNFWLTQAHSFRGGADPDMLEVGNGNLTAVESQTHFSLWCLLKAPLLLGNDLTKMTKETVAIVSNRKLIRVNQKYPPATCFVGCSDTADLSILASTATLNGVVRTVAIVVNWSESEWPAGVLAGHVIGVVPDTSTTPVMVVDLWTDRLVGMYDSVQALKNISLPVLPSHASVVLELSQLPGHGTPLQSTIPNKE